jgi:hypothetical protein
MVETFGMWLFFGFVTTVQHDYRRLLYGDWVFLTLLVSSFCLAANRWKLFSIFLFQSVLRLLSID